MVDGRAAVACRICVDEQVGDRGIDRGEIEEVLGIVGELPDVWDFMVGEWDFDSITSRFADEGAQEEYVRGLQGADHEARRRRRPVHVGRHDGADGARRRARPDRGGAAVDRRSVPAQEDRGGAVGGHPRVHRVQHLRHRATRPRRRSAAPRTRAWARSGGGAGTRSGSGRRSPTRACSSSAAGPAGLEAAMMLGQARLRGRAGRGRRRAGGRVARRGAAARARRLDPRGRLPPQPARAAAATSRSALGSRAHRRGGALLRLRPRRRRDRRALARRRRRPLAHPADRDRRRRAGADARRPARGRPRPTASASSIYDDDHYYMGGVLAELLRARGPATSRSSRPSRWPRRGR